MSSVEARKPLLAIDTSTTWASLALYGEAGVLAELGWTAGREQTVALLSALDQLLGYGGLTGPAELGAVAVALGPGSFNALRVGLSTAKGLCFALGLPLLGVPTLDATAYPHVARGRPVRAVIAAGRERFVSALYRWSEDGPWRAGEYTNTTFAGLAALIAEPTLLCGELPAGRQHDWPDTAQQAPAALGVRRAASLAELAWARWRRGECDDPAALEPVYLHSPAPARAAGQG
ncbi:MAG: tRNA (adenosine(37)-N6)-threonylcarbamoyltransferase complex dimerization subunit type 1 TsaB [Thermomicrobiales bacterium]